jgi:hypothetical protein
MGVQKHHKKRFTKKIRLSIFLLRFWAFLDKGTEKCDNKKITNKLHVPNPQAPGQTKYVRRTYIGCFFLFFSATPCLARSGSWRFSLAAGDLALAQCPMSNGQWPVAHSGIRVPSALGPHGA